MGDQSQERPNILLIQTDQQRWDALGANGNDEIHTPNLDRLADDGVNFTRTFVNAPVCMPSRESYLTGRYPSELRIFQNGVTLPESVRTLPEYLGRYGYMTANIGKLHFLPHANRDHTKLHPAYGFDHLEISDEPGIYEDAYRAWVKKHAPDQLEHISHGLPPATKRYYENMGIEDGIPHPDPRFRTSSRPFPGDSEYTHTAFVARRTMQYLRDHRDDQFVCLTGFFSPHQPWIAPQRFLDLYDPEEFSLPEYPDHFETTHKQRDLDPDDPSAATFSDEELRDVRHGYYAMVSEVDYWVGEILDTLATLDLLENTLVVFTSDHGEDLGQHHRYGKGFPGYDSISRVPLLVHWPAGVENPGRDVDGLTELVDLLPTLMDAIGAPVPSNLQGQSFLPAIREDGYEGRDVALLESSSGKVIRTDRYRYAIEPDGSEQLYDLQVDPEEFHDVSDDEEYGSVLSECRRQLARRTTEVDIESERERDYHY